MNKIASTLPVSSRFNVQTGTHQWPDVERLGYSLFWWIVLIHSEITDIRSIINWREALSGVPMKDMREDPGQERVRRVNLTADLACCGHENRQTFRVIYSDRSSRTRNNGAVCRVRPIVMHTNKNFLWIYLIASLCLCRNFASGTRVCSLTLPFSLLLLSQ